ncbi:DNA replication and repair protein RecF [Candidatus Dependentiae bacterium]|nr:DNA replication and repair protein RecF [Candidatus Dependentiae bacterium]
MIIQSISLRQFRCFQDQEFDTDSRIVIVEGHNGSGKSSLLEAIHYACYLRSFRTHLNRDLMQIGQDFFYINVAYQPADASIPDHIQVGFSNQEGKVVKLNQQPVQSYKELIEQFRVVTLAADDLELINGAPELRRDFLNYAMALKDPAVLAVLKEYRHILEQRNTLLHQGMRHTAQPTDEWRVWTEQLWQAAHRVQLLRRVYLQELENAVNTLLRDYFTDTAPEGMSVSFLYQAKGLHDEETFEHFWQHYTVKQFAQECDWKRSLFGAHLDDFQVIFQHKKARIFASRGQQKLLVLLIKMAQLQQLSEQGEPGVLLLDDFMTDFDHNNVTRCITALKHLKYQLFLSTPISPAAFLQAIDLPDVQHIKLS